jgi:hypothetical protein
VPAIAEIVRKLRKKTASKQIIDATALAFLSRIDRNKPPTIVEFTPRIGHLASILGLLMKVNYKYN